MALIDDSLSANRPDPDDPGGLGAEESGTERTGPTQDYVVAIQQGGRLAEVGRHYDSANDPVTAWMCNRASGFPAGEGAPTDPVGREIDACHGPLAAARRWRNHVVQMTGGAP